MKRILALLLCFCVCLPFFSACKKEEAPPEIPPQSEQPPAAEPGPAPAPVKLNYNYLTGLYDLPDERVGMRPIAVSVNNNYESWPQYGISKADILVEIETEGGITRLMAIFSDVSDAGNIGSVRSLRHPFLEGVYQWDPIITHIGTSDYCEERLNMYGVSTLNGYYIDDFLYFDEVRFQTYATEHCKFTNAALIPEGLRKLNIRETLTQEMSPAFNFAPDSGEPVIPSGGEAVNVRFSFSGSYDGDLRYSAADQKYYKWQNGKKQVDAGNGSAQVAFDNCIVLFAQIRGIENSELIDVDYAAGGEGYYFTQGHFERIRWQKPAWDGDFVFTRPDGGALVLNPGTTYLAVIRDYLDDTLEIQ